MRELRRKDKQASVEEAIALLERAEYGVLSTAGIDNQPYGVPLNYVYKDNAIYFHCALQGHKIDALSSNPSVSFCVVGKTEIFPATFSCSFSSTMVFGTASEVLGAERDGALLWFLEKYSPEHLPEGREYIRKLDKVTKLIKIDIDHICGKKPPAGK